MSTRRPAPRGASRAPRPSSGQRHHASGGRPGPARAKTPARKSSGGLRKGRLLLALLIVAGLIALLWHVTRKPGKPVATVPAALAKEQPGSKAGHPRQNDKDDQDADSDPERFEFYDILPNQQVLPTRQIESRPAPRPLPPGAEPRVDAAAAAEEPRWLQAGAFRNAVEADRRRAQIRLLGLPARVQDGSDAGGQALHRVLVGPFNSTAGFDSARHALAAAGLEALPLSNPGVTQP